MKFVMFFIVFIVLLCNNVHQVFSADTEISYFENKNIGLGLMFPSSIVVYLGENVFLRLKETLENQEQCVYRKPESQIDVDVINSQRPANWETEPCGIFINNVTIEDQGYWRLTSRRENEMKRGISYVQVLTTLQLTENHHGLYYEPLEEFTPENTQYCYVYREGSSRNYNEEFPSHGTCKIPDTNLDPLANGIWDVRVGIAGQTEEIKFNVHVKSSELRYTKLLTKVEKMADGGIQLSCNFENFQSEIYRINFCRFKRVSDNYGMNLDEGQGKMTYNYFGAGMAEGECGLMIQKPDSNDKGLWKCYVGVESGFDSENEEDYITHTVGAILDVSDFPHKLESITVEDIAILENQNLNILCESNIHIDYCWFQHPNGDRMSVTDEIDSEREDSKYWYYGNGFMLGQCGITLKNAQTSDSGVWSCHVGGTDKAQMEVSRSLNVRVTSTNLVAPTNKKTVEAGENLLIHCNSIPRNTPLEYCRFTMPNGDGFSINEDIKSDNPLNGLFFFNTNRKLQSGDCSIIVKGATMQHHGTWTCAARLLGWPSESFDDIEVEVRILAEPGMSVASAVGMSVGIAVVVLAAFGVVVYRYRKRQPNLLHEMEPTATIT